MNRAQYLLGATAALVFYLSMLFVSFYVEPTGPVQFLVTGAGVVCVVVAVGCLIEAFKQGIDSYEQEFGDDR